MSGLTMSLDGFIAGADSPGFSQRFTGTFGEDGSALTGFWEKSGDGEAWEHDFDLTYTKETK